MRSFRPFVLGAVLAAGIMAPAIGSPALGAPIVGMSDQQPRLFTDPRFIALRTPYVRYVMPYDAFLLHGFREDQATAWLDAAHAAGADVLLSFTATDRHPLALPSRSRYLRAVGALRARFPWLRTFSTWNEPNHPAQPFYRHPEAQARLYLALRRHCHGCTILASEPLDSSNLAVWIHRFTRVARGPQLWGLHNYEEANPRKGLPRNGTRRFLRLVRGQVWITETGGIVFFSKRGKVRRTRNLARAARGVEAVFRIADSSPRVRRVYLYQWNSTPGASWDSAFIGPSGKARRALLTVLARELRRHGRRHRKLRPASSPPPSSPPPGQNSGGSGSSPPPSGGGGSGSGGGGSGGGSGGGGSGSGGGGSGGGSGGSGGSGSGGGSPLPNPLCVIGLPGC